MELEFGKWDGGGEGVASLHFALDEFDTFLDVGLGLELILLDQDGSDELVHLVVGRKFGKLLFHLLVLPQLRIQRLACLDRRFKG